MISAVAGAFGGVSGGGGESGSIFNGVNSAFGAYGLGGSTDTQPAAYLNYILFDQNYKMLTMGWTRVPATPLVKHTLTLADINIKEPGYIFVYLSYESLSNNFVYFDDMKITHTRSKVIQYNEYYPFGMQTANSWTRENNTGNNFLANSGTELNATSNLYDLDYRQYDPVLGRLNGIDPMATKYASLSPYNFSFNDPVTFSDPSGADPYMDNKRSEIEASRNYDLERLYYNTHGVIGDDDLYGSMFERAGTFVGGVCYECSALGGIGLRNPGFTNANTWGMIYNAWLAMSSIANGTGRWNYSNGQILETPRILDFDRKKIVSGNFASTEFEQAASEAFTEIVNTITQSKGWGHTELKQFDQKQILGLYTSLGIPFMDQVIYLPELEVLDYSLNNKVKNTVGGLSVFGNFFEWGAADGVRTHTTSAVSKARMFGGVTQILSLSTQAYDMWNRRDNLSTKDWVDLSFNVGGAVLGTVLRANPVGLGLLTTANLIYLGVDIYNQNKGR